MAIASEVVVVGGGLAGATAALAAARGGADVRLLANKKSTLRHASGLIDVLGYVPGADGGRDGPVVDPLAAMSDLPEGHPYATVGVDAVREGLALFDDVAGEAYRGGHTGRNALVPTTGGTVKPTARYPAATAAGVASDDRPTLFVGFRRLTDFDGRMLAEGLAAAGVPFETVGAEVEFPGDLRADARLTRYAKLLDEDDPVEGGRGARAALARAVEPHLDGAERVGFPALLGDDRRDEVRAELSDRLGADVFEVPGGPPSLPGLRLEDLLFDALDEAGVGMSTGNPVVDYEARDGRLTGVEVDSEGRRVPYAAEEFVLATGGLVGKGLDSDREGVREPLFDCHVPHPADRYDWFVDDAFGDQPFARFGVVTDDRLRPLDADGEPEFENLRAAGGVLGGADVATEKSASGVSLASGLAAGRAAADESSDGPERTDGGTR
jgi:glycerol-3-phosphate dehydrogenase subunit B